MLPGVSGRNFGSGVLWRVRLVLDATRRGATSGLGVSLGRDVLSDTLLCPGAGESAPSRWSGEIAPGRESGEIVPGRGSGKSVPDRESGAACASLPTDDFLAGRDGVPSSGYLLRGVSGVL